MKVEILSTDTRRYEIDGRAYQSQIGWAHLPSAPYPQEIQFTVDAPYPVGVYTLDLEPSITIRSRKLQLGRLRLVRDAG